MKLKKGKIIFLCIVIISILLIITTALVFRLLKNDNESVKTEKINLNFESRIKKLEELESEYYKIGWLQVQGTSIDLPIFDFTISEENKDYSYGWRSPNYVSDENREVLLGHNVLNVSNNPIISAKGLKDFESLMAFSYASFAKDNLYIQYTKDGIDELYAIYAIGFYNHGYDMAESMNDSEKIKEYINDVRNNSIYDYDIDVNENDYLITVKTCTRYFGNSEKQQFIIDARKVRESEEIIKYNVKTNKLFDELILVEKTETK